MDGYVGEIRMFAGNYAPEGWALCNGQTLPVNGNEVLYSLIGTTYGGNTTAFNLPDLRGRVPIHQGLTYSLAQSLGTEMTTMTTSQMPPHTHILAAQTLEGTSSSPVSNIFAGTGTGDNDYITVAGSSALGDGSLSYEGGNQPFNLIQPSKAITFIIALLGNYPPQP
jgi:microcystin-dependent protein